MLYLIFYVGTDLNLYCKMATRKGRMSNKVELLLASLIYMSIFDHAERLIDQDDSLGTQYDYYHFSFWIGFVPFFVMKYRENLKVDVSRLYSWITTKEIFDHDKVKFDTFKETSND